MVVRSKETEEAYLKAGRRHLRRAQRMWPAITDPVEALCVALERETDVLRPATTRLYRQEVGAVLRSLCADSDLNSLNAAVQRVDVALRARGGIPKVPRTASRKVTDATADEAMTLFWYLALRARGRSDRDLVPLLALFIFFVPRTGCRPVEWVDARIDGDWLVVRNAKAGNGRAGAVERSIGLGAYRPKVREAARLFVAAVGPSVARYPSFAHWRNALSEMLARACHACGLRRLSLYSFRHTAIATWSKSGLSRAAIAALAGHASLVTAGRHYAGAGSGWEPRDGLAMPDRDRVRALERAASAPVAPAERIPAPEPEFDLAPMPMPSKPPSTRDPAAAALAAEAARAHHARITAAVVRRGQSARPEEPLADEPGGPAP